MPFAVSLMGNASCRAIYIGLGANQAYRGRAPLGTLNSALRCLAAAGVQTIAASRPWRSPAWPDPSDPPFVNACIAVRTDHDPQALMAVLHETEAAHGRARTVRNAPRTLDLDLLDYEGRTGRFRCHTAKPDRRPAPGGPPRLPSGGRGVVRCGVRLEGGARVGYLHGFTSRMIVRRPAHGPRHR